MRMKEEQTESQSPFVCRTPSDSSDFLESDAMSLEPLYPLDMSTDRTTDLEVDPVAV